MVKLNACTVIYFLQTPNVPKEAVEQLLHLTHSLRSTNDPTVRCHTVSLYHHKQNLLYLLYAMHENEYKKLLLVQHNID